MGFLPADQLNSYFQSSYFIESCQNRLTAFRTNNFSIKFPLQNNRYNQVIYRTADNADRHCHKKQAVEQVISVFLVSAGTKNQAAAG